MIRRSFLVNGLIYAFLGVCFSLTAFQAYLALGPAHPLDVKAVTILSPTVPAGRSMAYRFDYCQDSTRTPLVYRQLVNENGDVVPLAGVLGVVHHGCRASDILLIVPEGTPAGTYRLRGLLIYQVNSVRSVTVEYLSTNTFEIVSAPK